MPDKLTGRCDFPRPVGRGGQSRGPARFRPFAGGLHSGDSPSTAAVATAADVAVACLARIHSLAVDGRALPALQFRFYTDAPSGLQGILTYIPVNDLPRSRHVLTVRRPAEPDADSPAAGTYSIPFWL